MHWHKKRLVATTVVVATAATSAAALAAVNRPDGPAHAGKAAAKHEHVKAKIKKGTLTVDGTRADDTLTLRLRAGDPTTLEVDVDNTASNRLSFNRSEFDQIVVNAGAGDDVVTVDQANGVFTDTEATTISGESGNDKLTGGSGGETLQGDEGDDTLHGGAGVDALHGGSGNDFVDGDGGDDTASLGAGDDTFQWDPGDGSDVVEGQDGSDTMLFNGANADEQVDLSANGNRLRFFRNLANITMDTHGVESVLFRALGGTDIVTVNDLSGTDVTSVKTDLSTADGGNDGRPDRVVVNGTAAADNVQVTAVPGETHVSGLSAAVAVANGEPADALVVNGLAGDDRVAAEPAAGQLIPVQIDGGDGVDTAVAQGSDANDSIQVSAAAPAVVFTGGTGSVQAQAEKLLVDARGGDDRVSAGNGLSTLVALTIDGGAGNDTIGGGDGADVLLGGDGNDFVDGNRGNDTASLGAGDDTFQWDPGDGSDVVEGQDGSDTMLFNGANVDEQVDLSANGKRLRFFRNVANITMDTNGVETVDFRALGGADTVTVNDLTGTDVKSVKTDLGAAGGGGDGKPDTVIVNGTNGNDAITVTGSAGTVNVAGLAATVAIVNAEAANDTLAVNARAGDDAVDASALPADAIKLTVDGGDGNDVLIGGAGNDVLSGGAGDDVLIGGPGLDTLDGGPGDNIVIQD